MTFVYTMRNQGPGTASGIVLSNPLPPSLIVKSMVATNGACTNAGGFLKCELASLPAAATSAVVLIAIPMSAQTITNRIFLMAQTPDPAPGNNRYTDYVNVVPLSPGPDLQVPRRLHQATRLNDGRVLMTGGETTPQHSDNGVTATAEVFDPTNETFTVVGSMTTRRRSHTATLLPNGLVWVAGGSTGDVATATTDLYNPATGQFTPSSPLSTPRGGHTASLLPDGRVLIAGDDTRSLTQVEVFDYRTGVVAPAGDLLLARAGHTATVLSDGRVLFVGGALDQTHAEVYDPATGLSTPAGHTDGVKTPLAAALLFDGRAFLVGLTNAQLYDPVSGLLVPTQPPSVKSRRQVWATLLQDGRVMVTGPGWAYNWPVEIYDPGSGRFAYYPELAQERSRYSTTRLDDGRVLIAGGDLPQIFATASTELYVVFGDADLDGMDDQWESGHALSPANRNDAIQDPDGDGHINLQEYLAGTDPRDPNSVMRIRIVVLSDDAMRIDFNTVPEKRYRIEFASTAQAQNWRVVVDNLVGTGAVLRITVPREPGQPRGIYRVGVLP